MNENVAVAAMLGFMGGMLFALFVNSGQDKRKTERITRALDRLVDEVERP